MHTNEKTTKKAIYWVIYVSIQTHGYTESHFLIRKHSVKADFGGIKVKRGFLVFWKTEVVCYCLSYRDRGNTPKTRSFRLRLRLGIVIFQGKSQLM